MVAVAAVAGFPIVSACTSPGAEFTAQHESAIVDSVLTTLEEFAAASSSGRWDDVAARYSDRTDFIWLEDGTIRYRSADEVSESLASVTSMASEARLTLTDPAVVALAPGKASVAFGFEQAFGTADGGGFEFSGVISAVMVHAEDGWVFLHGHTSTARRDP